MECILRLRVCARQVVAALLVAQGLVACSPALDWRDVHPPGSAVKLQFPCRPDTQQRAMVLAGASVSVSLRVCTAGEVTWGLLQADAVDPERVDAVLSTLRQSAATNIGTRPGALTPQQVPGSTPQPGAGRSSLEGQRPDGATVRLLTLSFVYGTQVFLASVLATDPVGEAAETYFASIRIQP
jgi:hypothetical protein